MASCNADGFTLDALSSTTQSSTAPISSLASNLMNTLNVQPQIRSGDDMTLGTVPTQNVGGMKEVWGSPEVQQQQGGMSLASPASRQQGGQGIVRNPQMESQALITQNALQMSTLNSLKSSHAHRSELIEKEHAEFKLKQSQKLNSNLELEKEWNDLDSKLGGVTMEELSKAWAEAEDSRDNEVREFGVEQPRSYNFVNTFSSLDTNIDYFALGVQEFDLGNLKPAIQNFEAAIKIDNTLSAAWSYLGRSHAESDSDTSAIICFENGCLHDCYDLDLLLSLSVSYVNEGDDIRSSRSLKGWVKNNPDYAGIQESDNVKEMLENCLKIRETPELLQALGVLYNTSREWDKAVSVLSRAAEINPGYEVFNKLGATLANAGRSGEGENK
ncbi:hypothetical protein TL16_g10923 [Triparma laevis f. inornata]|uniref:Peroxin-5 n=1 Tax=Triparma laevis f. inornata TaxID=1714386 RepID=A0A9W7BJ61_9STRA|nr:hypothetical protein TL16_g10923 [Triparma laevis f. inornata]